MGGISLGPRASIVSALNSTTTPLGVDGVFTGEVEDVTNFTNISVTVISDRASATDGLVMEFSPDGVNFDTSDTFTISANTGETYTAGCAARYFRIRYTNGSLAQTYFRLQSLYQPNRPKASSHRIGDVIDAENDAELVKSVSTGRTPDGPFINFPAGGIVSAMSTNSTLLANASYNASANPVSVAGFVAVAVTVNSNVSSASNGVVIEFFADFSATRLVKRSQFTYGTAGIGQTFQVPSVPAPWLRVRYTNGGTNQTSFELVTTLSTTAPPPDILSISETITGNNAAQIVKSQIVGLQENGTYSNAALSNTGSFKVAITDRPSEVRNRVRKSAAIFRSALTASNTTVYTVTNGKTLYITSFIASFINNANAIGEWRLRDGTTDILGFVSGEKSVGASAPSQATGPNLPEPIPFTTAVNCNEISGDIQLSFWFIGYEE